MPFRKRDIFEAVLGLILPLLHIHWFMTAPYSAPRLGAALVTGLIVPLGLALSLIGIFMPKFRFMLHLSVGLCLFFLIINYVDQYLNMQP